MTGSVQKHIDSSGEMRPSAGHRGRDDRTAKRDSKLGYAGKTGGVRARIAVRPHHEIVARQLAFEVDVPRDPARDRMERKQSFENELQDQGAIVAAGDVRRLVNAE